MWVRGLKPLLIDEIITPPTSHPMWVRGLKQHSQAYWYEMHRVAPYVGAWIETPMEVPIVTQ